MQLWSCRPGTRTPDWDIKVYLHGKAKQALCCTSGSLNIQCDNPMHHLTDHLTKFGSAGATINGCNFTRFLKFPILGNISHVSHSGHVFGTWLVLGNFQENRNLFLKVPYSGQYLTCFSCCGIGFVRENRALLNVCREMFWRCGTSVRGWRLQRKVLERVRRPWWLWNRQDNSRSAGSKFHW